jgi:hypothetical protein
LATLSIGYSCNASGYISTGIGSSINTEVPYAIGIGLECDVTGISAACLGSYHTTSVEAGLTTGEYGSNITYYGCRSHSSGTETGINIVQLNEFGMVGSTPGATVGENVTLTMGDGVTTVIETVGTSQTVTVKVTMFGIISSVGYSQTFIQHVNVIGATIAGMDTVNQFGSAGASSWTMTVTAASGGISITMSTGTTQVAATVMARIENEQLN